MTTEKYPTCKWCGYKFENPMVWGGLRIAAYEWSLDAIDAEEDEPAYLASCERKEWALEQENPKKTEQVKRWRDEAGV